MRVCLTDFVKKYKYLTRSMEIRIDGVFDKQVYECATVFVKQDFSHRLDAMKDIMLFFKRFMIHSQEIGVVIWFCA